MKKETSHIKTWKDQETTKLDKKIQWLSQNLEVFLVSSESERLNLPHGKVSYRKQPFHVKFGRKQAHFRWICENESIRR